KNEKTYSLALVHVSTSKGKNACFMRRQWSRKKYADSFAHRLIKTDHRKCHYARAGWWDKTKEIYRTNWLYARSFYISKITNFTRNYPILCDPEKHSERTLSEHFRESWIIREALGENKLFF